MKQGFSVQILRSIGVCVLLAALSLASLSCEDPTCEAAPTPEDGGEIRIAVLSPAIADLLVELGLGERIVGRHAFDAFTDQSLPTVGDQSGIDYERLLRARPTHVLLEQGVQALPGRLTSLAESRCWEITALPLLSLNDIRSATRTLGALFAVQESAEELIESMDLAWSVVEGARDRAGRTLPLYWTNPIGIAGPRSFHYQILVAMGIELAIDSGSPYIEMDPEDLRRLDPDTIVIFAPGVEDLNALLEPLQRLQLRAIADDRVILVNDPKCLTPSGAMIDVAETVAEALAALPVP